MPQDFCANGVLVSTGLETTLSSGLLTILYGGGIVGWLVIAIVVLGTVGSVLFSYLSNRYLEQLQ